MHVRTDLRAGECAPCSAQKLAQSVQNLTPQVDSARLAALAGQFGLQVTPQQVQPMLQMAQGITTPDQFLAVVSR